jgi:phosphate/phosphite/phosphonate ABC transporter binding protein
VRIGIRQRLIILLFSGLFVAMGLIGTYRYVKERRDIINATRSQGEQAGKLMAELAGPYIQASDFSGLNSLAEHFLHTDDVQEVTVTDADGRQLVHAARPVPAEQPVTVGPFPVKSDFLKLGAVSLAVHPADLSARLRAYAASVLFEHLFIFILLATVLLVSVTRTVTLPVKRLADTLKDTIDRKDFTRRAEVDRRDEIGALASGVNYLIERLEQFIAAMGDISSKINELSPTIASETREVRKNSETEAEAILSVSSSVAQMSSSIQSTAAGAESLSTAAEETSSAILEMNASNQEVANHIGELTSSVEDVTTSVTEMIASIREVAGHVESLSSAAEETSASAIQMEATVREVERAATESTKLSQQVSQEAREIGVRSIQETVEAIATIKTAVGRYSDLVNRLGKRSEEIGKILGVIVEVTERTNLLALNASILAAQAGEHGKGFAVVAEEIKALADRTSGSAQDIGKLITAVQKETKEAVAAMSGSLDAVEEGVRRSQEAGSALDKILQSSKSSAEMATMIERAMTEQARGIKQVSEAVTNVKQMASQISGATHAQTKGTEMILGAAEGMRDIARRVGSAMKEQGRGGKQIVVAAEDVTKNSGMIASGTRQQQDAARQVLQAMERIQDLPRQNIRRVEGLAASLKTLGEQAALLDQELVTMKVRRGYRDSAGDVLKMGVIPIEAPAEMFRRFTPLADYLSSMVGKRVELSIAVDFAQTIKDLEEGRTDLAFLTPTTYIGAQKRFGATLLVKALKNGVPYTHSAVVARRDGGIKRIEEIKGKRFAFGDKMSTSSYLMPRALLADAGVTLDDLKEYAFLGHHDDVAKAVIAGEYDAGGLGESVARTFEDRGLVIIKTSAEIPEFNICASRTLDAETARLIRKALLMLDRKDGEQARLLTMIDPAYTGFVAASDGDYDEIRRIMETFPEAGLTA